MELVTSTFEKGLDIAVNEIKRHSNYMLRHQKNIEKLKTQRETLKEEIAAKQRAIAAAIRRGDEIEPVVENWLKDAETKTSQAAERYWDGKEEEAQKKCFFNMLPNLRARYMVSKKAIKEVQALEEALQKGKSLVIVSYRPELDISATTSRDYESLGSRKVVLDEILFAAGDPSVNVIGIYGPPGVGKTTLVKEVAKQAKEAKLFDAVVMAVVSRRPEIRGIQEQIADFVGLKFDEQSEFARAARLCRRVKKEKSILLILDNIWEIVNLGEVGVPSEDEHKGCKILLTSRYLDILRQMGCQKEIKVGVLSEEEAWNLFKRKAGNEVENSELQPTATEICKKCGGLPIAIVPTARALRGRTLSEWKEARELLEGPHSAVELAVKHLKSEEMRSAFLLCSLMPENTFTFDLLKYGTALNLFRGNITMEEARKKLSPLLQGLKSSDLLLESHTKDEFDMHDFIRDAAVSMAEKRGWLRGLADSNSLRRSRGLSLSQGDLKKLPEGLELPQLKFLRIENEDPSFRLPDDLFSKMKALEILDSIGVQLPKLPSSLSLLENLRTLCLESCLLEELSGIAELKKLEILSFCKSVIEKLPGEIGELARLKLLNLNDCSQLQVIPANVLSRLTSLEELYIGNSFTKWEPEEGTSNQVRRNVSIAELKNMTNLTTLEMQVPSSHIMPKDLIFDKLNNYNISIGDVPNLSGKHDLSRTLKLRLRESILLHRGIQMLLNKTQDLYLDELKGVKNILYDLDGEGFPQLKYLHVRNSIELRDIVNATGFFHPNEIPTLESLVNARDSFHPNAFPTLESLCLESLTNLENICNGQLMPQSFQNIRIIRVRNCYKLKNLFSFSIVKGLLHLEEIEVTNCRNMTDIVAADHDMSDRVELSRLQSLTLDCLPQLISFYTGERHSISLFNQELLLSNLECLKLSSISATQIWHDQLHVVPSCTRNLTNITLERCDGLRYIFRSYMVINLPQLKHLEISDCKMMEEIVYVEEVPNEERTREMFFPNLHTLRIKRLEKLARFCLGDYVEFPCLKQLQIENCPKLDRFICKSKQEGPSAHSPFFDNKVALPLLEMLMISHLKSLKKLCHGQLDAESFHDLKAMEIEHCEELQEIFPSNLLDQFSRLESLILNDCRSVEGLFDLAGLNVEETNALVLNHQLKNLRIYRLPNLKHVWDKDPNGILNFRNLNSIDIFGCGSLKNVFPTSVARDLPQLERLEIDTCFMLEEVVSKGEEPEVETLFEFPQLSFLKLWNLPELKRFYPGVHSVQCPMLKKLKTYHCDQTKIFGTQGLQRAQKKLSLIEQVLPHLEEVSLDSKMISLLSSKKFEGDLFDNIPKLQVHCFHRESDTAPLRFLQNFQSLENLDFGCCKFKNLFPFEAPIRLPKVKSLKLVALPNLEQIWREGSRPNLLLPSLESLWVWQSNNLTRIFPSSASFENLSILDIWSCERVAHIVASSTAKSLIHLIKLSIRECTMVSEIVADEEAEEQEEEVIIFSSLKCLELQNLPSLIYFCSGYCGFSFPALEDVTVKECPNLLMFSWGSLSTPKLRKVWVTEDKDQSYWRGELNTTFRYLYGKSVPDARDQYVEEYMDSYSTMDN